MQTRDAVLKSLKIDRGDLVLEVGGGQSPYWRSDILIDRYLFDDNERAGSLVIDRPFICADAHSIPFKDKSVDYIFCSQILEHLERPEAFFSELMRVGNKGYIETPNEFRERLICRSFHRWIISKQDNVLVLRKNTLSPVFGSLFHSLMRTREFNHFYNHHYSLFNIMFEWEAKFQYRFEDLVEFDQSSPSGWINALDIKSDDFNQLESKFFSIHAMLKTSFQIYLNAVNNFLKRKIRLLRRRFKVTKSRHFFELLCCPSCKSSLITHRDGTNIKCDHCSRFYPVLKGIPILLSDAKEVEDIYQRWQRGIEKQYS